MKQQFKKKIVEHFNNRQKLIANYLKKIKIPLKRTSTMEYMMTNDHRFDSEVLFKKLKTID